MKEAGKNEQMIGRLIKKRKEENDAFIKLLHAIENKTNAITAKKSKGKPK
jgi:hypothetical protein